MKITLEELKRTEMYKSLPIDEMRTLTTVNYLAFYYWYDDVLSEIVDIQGVKVVNDITLNLYKGMPQKNGVPYSIGYFQSPFDTQSMLFYQFLKYYFSYAKKTVGKDSEHYKTNNKNLLQFFANAKKIDLENIEAKQKSTMYENVFNINSRSSYVSAVERFVRASPQILEPIHIVSDAINTYYNKIKNKCFYGGCLDKIVMAVPIPNGGLISEKSGKLRYLYVGENSSVSKGDVSLQEAKKMQREGFEVSEIYAKTNWFYNKQDQKWRKSISDKESMILQNIPINTMFMKVDSKFNGKEKDVFRYMGEGRQGDSDINRLVREGWDIYLSDVFHHPTLYKHYPSLFKLPIFYGVNNRDLGSDNSYNFYYTPNGFLMIYGNQSDWDLKTVLLHEIQHAIQRIENFAQGGSPDLSSFIQQIGGENVKKYLHTHKRLKSVYKLGATSEGRYSYERFIKLYKDVAKIFKYSATEKQYYEDIDSAISVIINLYINETASGKLKYDQYLGNQITELIEVLKNINEMAKQSYSKLVGERGLSASEIQKVIFEGYESLAGEIESRDVQHNSDIEEEILGYALPMSSESIKEEKITAIFEEIESDEKLPSVIRGAIENIEDDRYIMHLFEGISAQPIMHELGHIVADLFGRSVVDLTITNNLNAHQIVNNGGIEETFCELFLCYLVKQNFTPRFTNDLLRGRTLMDVTIFDEEFNKMFFPKVDEAQEKAFLERLFFLKTLKELIENTIEEAPREEVLQQIVSQPTSQEVIVAEETPTSIAVKPILKYHCSYKGKSIEIIANSMYDAQLKAVPLLKANPKKGWEVSIHLISINGVEQLQSTVFEKGGNTNYLLNY
jgi:hypothetical protein